MKKTMAIVLALLLALTMSIVALAEGLLDGAEEATAEPTELNDETTDAEASAEAEPTDETVEEASDEADEVEAADEAADPTDAADPADAADTEDAAAPEDAVDEAADDEVAEDVESETNKETVVIDSDKDWTEWTAAERAAEHEVFSHRIQTGYCWEPYVSHKGEVHDLPAEIAEKYGTTDYEELPDILIYESIGTKDSTETLYVLYFAVDENGKKQWVGSETVTIEIPAGEVVYYPLDPGHEDWLCGYMAIVGGSYGDLSVELQGTITPPVLR